jgi:hypothetical protein
MDNENELQDSTQPEEEVITQETDDTGASQQKEALIELEQKNRQLFERAKKAEAEAKALRGSAEPTLEENAGESEDTLKSDVESLKLAERKRQFGYEHGLSPDETDAVFKLSPNPSKETLDDPFVKGGLESIRSQKRVNDNTPQPGGASQRIQPEKPIGEMDRSERNNYLKQVIASKKKQ